MLMEFQERRFRKKFSSLHVRLIRHRSERDSGDMPLHLDGLRITFQCGRVVCMPRLAQSKI